MTLACLGSGVLQLVDNFLFSDPDLPVKEKIQDYMTIPLDLYTGYFLAGLLVGTGKRDSFAASITLSRLPVLTSELAHRLDTFEK